MVERRLLPRAVANVKDKRSRLHYRCQARFRNRRVEVVVPTVEVISQTNASALEPLWFRRQHELAPSDLVLFLVRAAAHALYHDVVWDSFWLVAEVPCEATVIQLQVSKLLHVLEHLQPLVGVELDVPVQAENVLVGGNARLSLEKLCVFLALRSEAGLANSEICNVRC